MKALKSSKSSKAATGGRLFRCSVLTVFLPVLAASNALHGIRIAERATEDGPV